MYVCISVYWKWCLLKHVLRRDRKREKKKVLKKERERGGERRGGTNSHLEKDYIEPL